MSFIALVIMKGMLAEDGCCCCCCCCCCSCCALLNSTMPACKPPGL